MLSRMFHQRATPAERSHSLRYSDVSFRADRIADRVCEIVREILTLFFWCSKRDNAVFEMVACLSSLVSHVLSKTLLGHCVVHYCWPMVMLNNTQCWLRPVIINIRCSARANSADFVFMEPHFLISWVCYALAYFIVT